VGEYLDDAAGIAVSVLVEDVYRCEPDTARGRTGGRRLHGLAPLTGARSRTRSAHGRRLPHCAAPVAMVEVGSQRLVPELAQRHFAVRPVFLHFDPELQMHRALHRSLSSMRASDRFLRRSHLDR